MKSFLQLRTNRIATAVTVLTISSAAFAAPPAPVVNANQRLSFHRYYFNERRPLTLDTGRIALLRRDGARAADLAPIGETPADISPAVIPGWSFAATPVAERTAQGAVNLVAQAAAVPSVDFVSPVFIGDDGGPVVVTPHILVRFRQGVAPAEAQRLIEQLGAGVIEQRNWANMPGAYYIRSVARSGVETLDIANRLALLPETLFAEPDWMFTGRSSLIPNDPLFNQQWGLHNTAMNVGVPDMDMDVPEAWDITTGDPAIKVLVIDVGVDNAHADLNLIGGVDTTSETGAGEPINACDNHGTWVAGCISAKINNSLGVTGVAPSCVVSSARTFITNVAACNGSWSTFASWTINSIAFAETIGARVTNNSNFYGFTSAGIESKYSLTRANGMVHFASAGNASGATPTYPASLPTVVAVSALTNAGNLASFSNTGAAISAPGVGILTTDRTGAASIAGDFASVNGTSFASPYTAGVAALLLSVAPTLTAAQVEQTLASTAVDLGTPGFDTTFGAGFVNANNALLTVAIPCPGDLNGDGSVGSGDLAILLGTWGASGSADLDGDSVVGSSDLAIMLGTWGPCP